MQTVWWSGGIALPFLTLALHRDEWSASWPMLVYLQGKGPEYTLYRRLGKSQSSFGHCGQEKVYCPWWNIQDSLYYYIPVFFSSLVQSYSWNYRGKKHWGGRNTYSVVPMKETYPLYSANWLSISHPTSFLTRRTDTASLENVINTHYRQWPNRWHPATHPYFITLTDLPLYPWKPWNCHNFLQKRVILNNKSLKFQLKISTYNHPNAFHILMDFHPNKIKREQKYCH
jgi:hypothetical protein